eukprot:6475845-Amphidinium_carterae.1
MEVVLHILKDKHKKRLLHVLIVAVRPFRTYFAELQSETKTSWGRLNTVMEMAHGSDLALIAYRCLATLENPNTVHELRLSSSGMELTPSEVEDEKSIADQYFTLVVQLAGQHLSSAMHYTHSWPGRMVLLLSENVALQTQCLKELRTLWEWLMEMESQACGDSDVRSFLDDLQFPRWQWVREIAIDLWEHNFTRVTPFAQNALLECFSGMFSTNIIEDSFNRLKRLASQAPNKKIRRQRRYHGLQASGLQDEYGAPAPGRTSESASSSSLPKNLFEPNTETFSLGESALHDFLASSWVAPSPQRYGVVPMALQCSHQQREWGLVRKSWLSLLLEEGCVAVNGTSGTKAMLVLKVTKFGAIVWPLKQVMTGVKLHFAFEAPCAGNPLPWSLVHVSNLEDWKAARVRVLPPASQSDDVRAAVGCIRLELAAKTMRLSLFASQRCFKGLQVPQLKMLWKEIGCPLCDETGRKPTTEHDLCRVCTKHLQPELTDEQLSEVMAQRFKPKETSTLLFDEKNLEMVGPILDQADQHDLEEARKAHSKKVAKPSGTRKTRSEGTSSGSAVPAAERATVSLTGGHTPEEVKQYLPKNFRIALDDVRHKRWQIEDVLRRSSPFSYSKSYGDESVVSKNQALRMVLNTAWERHKGFTGET